MWQVGIEVRKDITAAVLRKKACGEKNGRVVARMLGIANILDGMERGAAARAVGMYRQTLCDWVTGSTDLLLPRYEHVITRVVAGDILHSGDTIIPLQEKRAMTDCATLL